MLNRSLSQVFPQMGLYTSLPSQKASKLLPILSSPPPLSLQLYYIHIRIFLYSYRKWNKNTRNTSFLSLCISFLFFLLTSIPNFLIPSCHSIPESSYLCLVTDTDNDQELSQGQTECSGLQMTECLCDCGSHPQCCWLCSLFLQQVLHNLSPHPLHALTLHPLGDWVPVCSILSHSFIHCLTFFSLILAT
jgi:hypothetical protein